MLAILNFLNAHNFPIFQPILMVLVSKFMVYRALSDKIYLLLGLLSPLILNTHIQLGCVTSLSLQYGRFHYSPFANIQTPTTSTFFNRFR